MGDDRWLGKAAVLWVLDEAPGVPPELVSTLLAYARYASEDGRGSYPATEVVAAHTRKSKRQAVRDIDALESRGLLVRGDQRKVAHIRKDRRPVVYDLPLPARGDAHDTPHGVTPTTPRNGHGVTPVTARGDTHDVNGVTPVTPEEILNRSRKGARDAAGAATPPRGRPKPPWCGECDERTRQIELDNGAPAKCPVCHPFGAAFAPANGRHAAESPR
jgi:hypothetical protein